ncbi:hypothetical protein [Streptomyces sp. NPDC058401]|uniref:hypothetical protein n=1 Tax=Streptomyces sp. NPDC058401 TaxID=3346480 RepID=UPI003656E48E
MKKTHAAWALAGAAALLLAGTPAAHAEPGQAPYIGWASSIAGDLGTLQIPISSDSDITGITARVIQDSTQAEVAVLEGDAFALSSGTARDGVWRTKEPLKLAALGGYSVQVGATDADGDYADGSGSLAYFVEALIEGVRTDRTTIDVDHRDIKVQGVLKGRWPGTREVKPLAGYPVDIDVRGAQATPVTDPRGRFSATVTLEQAGQVQPVFRYDPAHPEVLSGEGAATRIEVKQTPTRWTYVRSSATAVDLGQPVTVTAKLERRTSTGWEPFAGQRGGVVFRHTSGGQDEYLPGGFTTGADGTVTATLSPYESGHFLLTNRAEDDDPFTASVGGAGKEIEVRHPATFTRFAATRTEGGRVHVEGAMEFTGDTPGTIDVTVQFSRDGRHWADVATARADWGGEGYAFSADVVKNGAGWFRAKFTGPAGFQSATAAAVQVAG